MRPRNDMEDWLSELPPLDGADDEPDGNEGSADDMAIDDRDESSLDDATADDLDVDEGVEIAEEESASSEDDDQWEADVGEPELDLAEGEESDVDAPEGLSSPEELDVDPDLPASDDDAGEEGTTDPVENSLDEDLPALDADDEGDFEDKLLLEVGMTAPSSASRRWADALWEERSDSRHLLVWPADDDGSVAAMSISSPTGVVAALVDGRVAIASLRDPKARWCEEAPLAGHETPAFVALASQVLWVATRDGHLAKSADLGVTWTRCAGLARSVLALTAREDGSVSALVRRGTTLELLTSSDGTRWFAQAMAGEVPALLDAPGKSPTGDDPGKSPWIVQSRSAIAIGDATGVSIARDGRPFVRVPASAGATAGAFAGPLPDAPLLLVGAFEDGDEAIQLVRVSSEGISEIVGEIPSASPSEVGDEPRALAAVWHDASESLRVAFAARVVGVGPARVAR